ncbi:MAG: hypothetical protein HQK79_23265 [Desulfobacterales bacterium]|nr:hypothetical protein [Desulfobacterales bacterium]
MLNSYELVDKFKVEKKKISKNWKNEGFEYGQIWVKRSSFSEVEGYIDSLEYLLRIKQPWPDGDALAEYTENFQDNPEWTKTAAENFWKGFANGAETLWNQIHKK